MSQELDTTINDLLAELAQSYPQESGVNRLLLPRLTFKSQDVMEGKGKSKKVVIEAGTFFTERPTDEKNEEGKNIWDKTELGLEIEGIIVYRRKQLRFYDEPNDVYYSTPIFDDVNEVVPLFKGKEKYATGTTAQLKALFEFVNEEGKTRSKLEDNMVLYIIYADELYQMSLRGSSMYSFRDYEKKASPSVNTVLTVFNSEPQEKGSIQWNQMMFKAVRTINAEEAHLVVEYRDKIKEAIEAEKAYYAQAQQASEALPAGAVMAALPEAVLEKDKDF